MENRTQKQIFYRGLLKSCNYSCEYCPFSKHVSKRELEQDAVELERFVTFVTQSAQVGAIQIVPYGEALIHEYYWRAMAALSRLPQVEMVGCQTNLSFSVKHMLEVFDEEGGMREKLSLWCTFHPTMVSVESFLVQCNILEQERTAFCVGSVGVPEHRDVLLELREKLPGSVYMWVNPMDGLARAYTPEEVAAFVKIDPFFPYSNRHMKANPKQCRGCKGEALFVHANGDITACNMSKRKLGNLYEEFDLSAPVEVNSCGQRECSCFLAYSNRCDFMELVCYGKYPAFRRAVRPQALFLDVDGTLVKEGCETMDAEIVEQVAYWSQFAKIYLATSLPLNHAMKKCNSIKTFLAGGVFANGGMVCLFEEKECMISSISPKSLTMVGEFLKGYPLKVKEYKQKGQVYKITGIGKQSQAIYNALVEKCEEADISLTVVKEGDYLEITAQEADKLSGVLKICNYYNYNREAVVAMGNSQNDEAILEYFPMSVRI